MWKRKDENKKPGDLSYEDALMARMEEQFREGKRENDPNAEQNDGENQEMKEENDENDENGDKGKIDSS